MPFFKKRDKPTSGESSPIREASEDAEIEKTQPHALVSELGPVALKHFLGNEISRYGKFVRIGDVIIVAPSKYGQHSVQHNEMLEMALHSHSDELKSRIVGAQAVALTSGIKLLHETGVVDAGWFEIRSDDEGNLGDFALFGWSNGYGPVKDDEIRAQTMGIAEQNLGQEIPLRHLDENQQMQKMMQAH